MKTRKVFRGTSLARFNKSFQNDEDCYGYLADIKWKGNSFVCKRCGHTHYCKGQLPFARRCTRCKHDESPTAGTIFNKIRMSLLTAFRIAFDMCNSENNISSTKLAEKYGIRQKTIWEFKRKMQLALQGNDSNFLHGMVLLSDFCIMEKDSDQSAKSILVAIEVLDNGDIGNAYGMMLDCLSPASILRFFEQHININAKVYVSKNRVYEQLAIKNQMVINEDISLLNLSTKHISDLKTWLFGGHRHLLPKYIQGYLDEYYYLFNRRNKKIFLFDEFIGLMMQNQSNRI